MDFSFLLPTSDHHGFGFSLFLFIWFCFSFIVASRLKELISCVVKVTASHDIGREYVMATIGCYRGFAHDTEFNWFLVGVGLASAYVKG